MSNELIIFLLLQRMHPEQYECYENNNNKKKNGFNDGKRTSMNQYEFNLLLQNFIINGLHTFNLVEDSAFQKFIYGIVKPDFLVYSLITKNFSY